MTGGTVKTTGSPTLPALTFYNLEIAGSSQTVKLNGALTVNGNLTIDSTDKLNLNGYAATANTLTAGGTTYTAGSYNQSNLSAYISGTSTSISVSAGAANKLAFTTQPANTVAGVTMANVAVQIQDSSGNAVAQSGTAITVSLSSGSFASGTTSVNTDLSGKATFTNLVITTANSYTMTAAASGLTSGTSSSFNITAAAASKLVFTTSPVTVTAGVASSSITVQRQDAGGNPVTTESSTRTVTLTSSSSGTKTFTPSSSLTIANGSSSASFTYTDTKAGTPTLTAVSTSPNTITPATQQETVTPAAASQLVFTSTAVTVAAGVASGNITVQRQDQYGNPNTTDATRSLTLSSTSSGTVTFSPASPLSINNGSSSASFTYTDTKAGTPTITAASTSPTMSATQQERVNAATPSASVSTLAASLTSVTADGTTTSTITVTLKDANGNPVAGKTVSLTLSSGAGTPTITTIAGITDANGQGSWTVKSTTATPAAPDVFTALDSSDNVAVTQTASVTFTPGAMTHYAVTFSIPPFYAGGIWTTYATAEDTYGNTVTSASGTVTFSSSSANMKWDGNHDGAYSTPPRQSSHAFQRRRQHPHRGSDGGNRCDHYRQRWHLHRHFGAS